MKSYNFRIKRFNAEKDTQVWWDEFSVQMDSTERVLDGLLRIKDELDGSLAFRKSCAHGICGSCAMKINGENRLACQTLARDIRGTIVVEPLPAFPVVKDLVVDMDPFFVNNEKVLPYLINKEPAPERERLQSPADQHKTLQSVTCIMCACCTSSCPVYRADKEYLGPSALLKAYRFIFDSRDRAQAERLDGVTQKQGIWRCHTVYNCVEVCPKGIDVAGHISELKRLAVRKKTR